MFSGEQEGEGEADLRERKSTFPADRQGAGEVRFPVVVVVVVVFALALQEQHVLFFLSWQVSTLAHQLLAACQGLAEQ